MGWYKYSGKTGKCFGVDIFGYSGNELELYKKFGLNSDLIANDIAKIIKINKK
jgi:transketolase